MRLLNNHPDILLANEFGSMKSTLRNWKGQKLRPRQVFKRFYRDQTDTKYYLGNSRMYGLEIDRDSFYDSLEKYSTKEAVEVFVRRRASYVESKPAGTRVWGQKSPHLIDRAAELKGYYPEAKFIHIIRDVRNCVLSANMAWNTDLLR